ncbi:MAG: PH domain-containing protein [Coriobacteriales bacterium]|jgi:putative membrane protein
MGAPDSPSALASTFATGRRYRVHRSYVLLRPLTLAAAVLTVTLASSLDALVDAAGGSLGDALPPAWLVALVAVGTFAAFYLVSLAFIALAWRNLWFEFDQGEFSLYSGVISKRRQHLPYARVQSVGHRADLLQRVAGVCTVTVESAGGGANTTIRVPYLTLDAAERLRAEMLARRQAAQPGSGCELAYHGELDLPTDRRAKGEAAARAGGREGAGSPSASPRMPEPVADAPVGTAAQAAREAADGHALNDAGRAVGAWRGILGGSQADGGREASFQCGLSNRELLLTAVSHDSVVVAALSLAFTAAGMVGLWSLGGAPAAGGVALTLAALALGAVVATVSNALTFGGFSVRRVGDRVEVESGVLAHQYTGVDVERIQTVAVRQSLVRRLMGYCELSVGIISSPGSQSGGNSSKLNRGGLVIHPFVRLSEADRVIDALLPELAGRPNRDRLSPLPRPALRRALLRRGVWFNPWLWACLCVLATCAVASAGSGDPAAGDVARTVALATSAVCAAGSALRLAGAALWARGSGHALARDCVMVLNDGLRTSCVVVPRRKVQSAGTRANPFQRRLGLTTMRASTAAGASLVVSLVDVTEDEGLEWLGWLRPDR